MLNNKGFVVSAVLYTLLIAFLLFLGATLASFSSSNSIISNANKDLVDGTNFIAVQVKPSGACEGVGENKVSWYENSKNTPSKTIVKINTRYGVMYWPGDFKQGDALKTIKDVLDNNFDTSSKFISTKTDKIQVQVYKDTNTDTIFKLKITDTATNSHATYTNSINCDNSDSEKSCMGIYDLCK